MPTTSNGPPVSAISCSSRSSKLTKHITHELRWADPAAYPPRTSCWVPSCTAVDDFVIARDWREYRTHFHIAQTYQVSEATVRRITRQVEDAVIQHPLLHLSGKKRLLLASPGKAVSTVVVDVTECPVERPKKTAPFLQREEEAAHAKSPADCR